MNRVLILIFSEIPAMYSRMNKATAEIDSGFKEFEFCGFVSDCAALASSRPLREHRRWRCRS